MAFTHNITQKVTVGSGGGDVSKTVTATGSSKISVEESYLTATTNGLLNFTLDVSTCKSFYMVSDQNVLIETNSGSSPADTINLLAGIPYIWHSQSYDTFKFGTDITAIYVTNVSGSTATIQIECLADATP